MTITQIKYFIAVAQYRSFTKAADKLFISQPSLSRQISVMEQELGMRLFSRTGRDIRLTPAGSVLFSGLQKISDEYDTLVQSAENAQAGRTGSLRVGILNGTRVGDFMPRICRHFSEAYPDIELTLQSLSFDALLEALYNAKLDVIFTLNFYIEGREQIVYETIVQSLDYICYHKSHPMADRERVTLWDFRGDTFVLISPEDNARSSQLILEACEREGFAPNVRYAQNIYDQMLQVESGMGVTILDTRNVMHTNPTIVMRPIESHWDPSLVVAWHKQNYNPAIRIFFKALKQFPPEH